MRNVVISDIEINVLSKMFTSNETPHSYQEKFKFPTKNAIEVKFFTRYAVYIEMQSFEIVYQSNNTTFAVEAIRKMFFF